MTNPFDALISAGMAQATGVLGEPITIDGKVYSAIIDRFHMSREMKLNGFRVDFELVAIIPLSAMPKPPQDDDPGEYKGQKIRIVRDGVTVDAGAYTIKFAYAG